MTTGAPSCRLVLAIVCGGGLAVAAPEAAVLPCDLRAPNADAPPVNQLVVSGNACGPAALMSAFGCGDDRWQRVVEAVPGRDTRQQLTSVIRLHGQKESAHLGGRMRWDRAHGVNLVDLADIANEMRRDPAAPRVDPEVLVQKRFESRRGLLRRAHRLMARSLKRGLPPVISLRRLALRNPPRTEQKVWSLVRGHFAVVIAMPARLPRTAGSFPIRYIDPWGGKVLDGRVVLDDTPGAPALRAEVPSSHVGKRYLRDGEDSIVVLAAALGDF